MENSAENTTHEQFIKFHKEHPEVWEYFNRFSIIALSKGYTRFSARMVMERVRWETMAGEKNIVTDPRHLSTFKINNNYIPHYARLFIDTHNLPNFFETRELKSKSGGHKHEAKNDQGCDQQES